MVETACENVKMSVFGMALRLRKKSEKKSDTKESVKFTREARRTDADLSALSVIKCQGAETKTHTSGNPPPEGHSNDFKKSTPASVKHLSPVTMCRSQPRAQLGPTIICLVSPEPTFQIPPQNDPKWKHTLSK